MGGIWPPWADTSAAECLRYDTCWPGIEIKIRIKIKKAKRQRDPVVPWFLFEGDSAVTEHAKWTTATIVPALRYRNAPAAVEWLCKAFGFERHMVVPGENDTIAHAQLWFGNGMIMLGSARDDDFGRMMQPPSGPDRINTQSCYVIVNDADAHCEQAKAAGAEIIKDVEDQPYGGRLYICRDLEGHVWNFGTYDPWSEG